MREIFVANLASLMKARDWVPDDIAPHAGVSRGTIYKYLSGERSPHMETADKIASAFGLTLVDMLRPIGECEAAAWARMSVYFSRMDSEGRAALMRVAQSLAQSPPGDSRES